MTRKKPVVSISKIVIYGDVHDPFVDEHVFQMFLEALRIIKPTQIIENGDGFDFFQLSQFSKDPARGNDLAGDRDTFIERRLAISDAVGKKCAKHYLPGNHERRLQKYLWTKAPELSGLKELSWFDFLGLEDMDWFYNDFEHAQNPMIDCGDLIVTHGHIVRKHSAYSARAVYEDYGQSVLVNHTHRLGSYWRSTLDTTHGAWENGCMCSLEAGAHYLKGAINWQRGFSVVSVERSTGWFRVHQIPIIRRADKPINRLMLHEGVLECPA